MEACGADNVAVIEHDAYYHAQDDLSPEERSRINYDHPDALETALLVQHLTSLRAGSPVEIPVYDFEHHARKPETVTAHPRPTIIVEGILVLAEKELRELMDIRVFVDTDADIRILRRLKRDIAKRGRSFESVVEQYLATVRPMHLEFVEPSKRHAHIIMPEGARNVVALDMLLTKIGSILASQ